MTAHSTNSSSPNANGDPVASTEAELEELEIEIAQLSEIVESNPTLVGGEDVAELLKRLTNAEAMAQGMETKIDGVLQNLDNLLDALDKRIMDIDNPESIGEGDAVVSSSEAQNNQVDP